jgi:hypothetical protein
MAFTAGSDIVAADFVSSSSGAGDSGKAPLLNTNGVLVNGFYGYEAFTAQEAIAADDAVVIGDGLEYLLTSSTLQTASQNCHGVNWASQSFVSSAGAVSISKVTARLSNVNGGSSSSTFTVSIRANSGGQPTGADLGSIAVGSPTIGSGLSTDMTFTFSSPIAISPSTTYHVVIRGSTANWIIQSGNTGGTGSNVSTNSGSSWSSANGPLYCAVFEIDTVAGQISKATAALVARARSNNFIGFALNAISASASGLVKVSGAYPNHSGLTAGLIYYLSNTYGAIASTAGTISRKIGVALSTTSVLIRHDNP